MKKVDESYLILKKKVDLKSYAVEIKFIENLEYEHQKFITAISETTLIQCHEIIVDNMIAQEIVKIPLGDLILEFTITGNNYQQKFERR